MFIPLSHGDWWKVSLRVFSWDCSCIALLWFSFPLCLWLQLYYLSLSWDKHNFPTFESVITNLLLSLRKRKKIYIYICCFLTAPPQKDKRRLVKTLNFSEKRNLWSWNRQVIMSSLPQGRLCSPWGSWSNWHTSSALMHQRWHLRRSLLRLVSGPWQIKIKDGKSRKLWSAATKSHPRSR